MSLLFRKIVLLALNISTLYMNPGSEGMKDSEILLFAYK